MSTSVIAAGSELTCYSEGYVGHGDLFHDIREQQTASDELSGRQIPNKSFCRGGRWWAMWRCELGVDIPHRFSEKHLPTKLPHALQRRESQEGAENSVLQQKDVPRSGRFHGTKLCRELDFLFRI